MQSIGLFEDLFLKKFFPLAMTRHVAQLRWGIFTIQEKWEKAGFKVQLMSDRPMFKGVITSDTQIFVNARYIPSIDLLSVLSEMTPNHGWMINGIPVICKSDQSDWGNVQWEEKEINFPALRQTADLFLALGDRIAEDSEYFEGQHSEGRYNQIIGDPKLLKMSNSAKVNGAFLNTTDGPIVIDEGAEVMEGCMIRGPFYLGKGATLKMGAKIYGPTVLGEQCKVGGEVSNSVFFGFTNKAHDGFIGNAVIGEWCNLGADTNCSNLKNNYSPVKQYCYLEQKEISTGLTFCGLVMGDYSKSGINTMFNTGTVVGVGANVYGGGFLPKHIPSFYWGNEQEAQTYQLDKCMETIAVVKSRRHMDLSVFDKQLLTDLHKEYAFH